MDSHRPSIRGSKCRPCDYYFVQHDFDGFGDAMVVVGLVCVCWSPTRLGCYCGNHWNGLLAVRLDFGDSLNCALAGRGSDNDVTYHLNNYWRARVVQSVAIEFLDYLWP